MGREDGEIREKQFLYQKLQILTISAFEKKRYNTSLKKTQTSAYFGNYTRCGKTN
jgi:hypothetical protein